MSRPLIAKIKKMMTCPHFVIILVACSFIWRLSFYLAWLCSLYHYFWKVSAEECAAGSNLLAKDVPSVLISGTNATRHELKLN